MLFFGTPQQKLLLWKVQMPPIKSSFSWIGKCETNRREYWIQLGEYKPFTFVVGQGSLIPFFDIFFSCLSRRQTIVAIMEMKIDGKAILSARVRSGCTSKCVPLEDFFTLNPKWYHSKKSEWERCDSHEEESNKIKDPKELMGEIVLDTSLLFFGNESQPRPSMEEDFTDRMRKAWERAHEIGKQDQGPEEMAKEKEKEDIAVAKDTAVAASTIKENTIDPSLGHH